MSCLSHWLCFFFLPHSLPENNSSTRGLLINGSIHHWRPNRYWEEVCQGRQTPLGVPQMCQLSGAADKSIPIYANSLWGAFGASVQPAVAFLLRQQGDRLPLGEGQQGAVGAGGLVGHARPHGSPTCRPADSCRRRSCRKINK